MKKSFDLNTFAKTLTDKGYNRTFVTEEDYPDEIERSIKRFLDTCKTGKDRPTIPNTLMLRTYLEWNGNDRPHTHCTMWVKWKNNTFDVQKMEIERSDRFGHLLKKLELKNLSTEMVPTVKEILGFVIEKPKERIATRKKGFRI